MSAARRDYYEVLGVEPGADAGGIKTAFRSRARMLHPDVSAEPDAGTRDGRRIALADGGETVVRVLPAPCDHRGARLAAALGLVLAVALLAVVLFS